MNKVNRVLIVVAHCDDELLGAGCYISKLIENGDAVYVCCMTSYSDVREENIDEKMKQIHKELGVVKTYIAPYGASAIENVPHLDKVKFIEGVILDSKCNMVITHSNLDLHKDHVEVSDLTMEAVRYYQRRPDKYADNAIQQVMMMEVPCASLWGGERFNPNAFAKTNLEDIEKKVKLVGSYDNVIRQNPHPRSLDNIIALAKVRGAQCGTEYAEAFRIVYKEI